jgi:ABC-2 type transport system permease protein
MLARAVRKYGVLGAKGFLQNLQYSASHLINTVASAIFGLVYIYLWKTVTPVEGFADYTVETVIHYIIFNQIILWFTEFSIRTHTRIRDSVRSGNVATELARPMGFFAYRVASDYGSQIYSFLFRGLPVGIMLSGFGYHTPQQPATWGWTLLSLVLGAYVSIILKYIVGVTAFWTTEIRTASYVESSLVLGLGGASMPLEVLPAVAERLAVLTPFPCLCYYPTRIFLELSGPALIWRSLFWAIALTAIAQILTAIVRRKLEVQGG